MYRHFISNSQRRVLGIQDKSSVYRGEVPEAQGVATVSTIVEEPAPAQQFVGTLPESYLSELTPWLDAVTLYNTGSVDLGSGYLAADVVKIHDSDDSHELSFVWNEAETSADRTLNLLVNGGARTLDLAENLKILDGQDIELHASGGEKAQLAIDTQNAERTLDLSENLTVADGYNVTLQALGQANSLILNENLTVGDGYAGTLTFSVASKVLTVDESASMSDFVREADFDATTFLYATADNTPQAKTPAETMAILSSEATEAFDFNSQNLTSVGTIGCNEITIADGHGLNLQEDITFTGATTVNQIKFPDNLPVALAFQEGANLYQSFVTTNDSEAVIFHKNVGIGTTSPNSLLNLMATSNPRIKLDNGDGASLIEIIGGTTAGGWLPESAVNDGIIRAYTGKLLLGTGTTLGMAITSGNVGIGTTSPTHKIELAAATTAAGGMAFGTDVELYRSAANVLTLTAGDSFDIAGHNASTVGLKLDGTLVTTSAAELNILHGVTGVTAAELSYIGDVTGLIQAQLDAKAPIDAPTFTTSVTIPETAGESDYDKFLVVDTGVIKYRTDAQVLSDIGGEASGTAATAISDHESTYNHANYDTAYDWGDHAGLYELVGISVLEADYNAHTILAATTDDTPVALTVGEQTLVGRITSGNIAALTTTQVRTLLNVADGADVTGSNAPQAHTASHAVGGADSVFPANPDADKYLMWDNDPGELVWAAGGGGASALNDLTDVTITGPADLDLLQYDNGSSKWVDRSLSEAGIQPLDATLTSLAALGTAADKMLYTTDVDTWAEAAITAAGRALLDDADAAAQRTTLALGADVTGFATVNAILAVANAAVDLNSQDLTGVGTIETSGAITTTMAMDATYPNLIGFHQMVSSDAQAIGKGGVLSFGGKHTDAGAYTTFATIRGVKHDSTSGNFAGKVYLGARTGITANLAEVSLDKYGNFDVINHDGSTVGLKLGGTLVTTSAAELNILHGVTGVTAAELSYIGDVTGLIQAQLDAKAPIDAPTFTTSVTIPETSHDADPDKFLCSVSGLVKYRTGAQVLSDIGGEASGTAATAVSNHEAAADPHTGYAKESVVGTSISTGLLLDGTALKVSAILQKYHAIDPSADVQSLLGCATEAAIRTLLDLEAGTDFYSIVAVDNALALKAPLASPNFTGTVTKPDQPSFLVKPAFNQNNIAVNSYVTVIWGTEVFDTGNNFSSNTFTAPVTGKYFFSVSLQMENLDSAADHYYVRIVTTGETYPARYSFYGMTGDVPEWHLTLSALVEMSADDTAYVDVYQNNGAQQTDIVSGPGTTFCGWLVA